MSIPDNYEINVAIKQNPTDKYGKHWCKIQLPDSFEEQAEEKLAILREMFGDQFNVTMTKWECRGKHKEEWD